MFAINHQEGQGKMRSYQPQMTMQLGISQYTSHLLNLQDSFVAFLQNISLFTSEVSSLFSLVCCCLSVSLSLSVLRSPLLWLWARGDRFRGGTGSIFSTWTNDTVTQAWTTLLLRVQRHFHGKPDSWHGHKAHLQPLKSKLNLNVFLREFVFSGRNFYIYWDVSNHLMDSRVISLGQKTPVIKSKWVQ